MTQPWFLYNVTRGYTDPAHGNHDGWDFGAPSKTPLISLTGGKVTSHTGWYPWGGEIDTKGPTGVTETFAHADRIDVKAGDIVFPGQQVGLSGGENLPRQYSTGPHIHYSLFGGAPWDNKNAIDPSKFLNSVRGNPGSVGTMAGSAGLDTGDIPGVGAIADAIDNAYKGAETALASAVKRAGYFVLGMGLVILGVVVLTVAVARRGARELGPTVTAATGVPIP